MAFKVEIEQEQDLRWIAEVLGLSGVVAYGPAPKSAIAKVQTIALSIIADRLDHGETGPDLLNLAFDVG